MFTSAADQLKSRVGQFTPIVQRPPRIKAPQTAKGRARNGSGAGRGANQRPTQRPFIPRSSVRTAYTVLGVDPGAEPEVLKAAYQAKARLYHPDMNKDPRAVDRMKELNVAWEILKDPVKRHQYDRAMGLS